MKALRTLSHLQASWLPWFPVTGGGWTIGLIVAAAVTKLAGLVLPMQVDLVIAGIAAGMVLGLAQWFTLHPEVRGVGSWMTASGIGWTIGVGLAVLAAMMTNSFVGTLIGAILGSLAFGFAQWLALRPEARTRSGWLFLTIVGWAASMTLGIFLGAGSPSTPIDTIVQIAQDGAVGLVIIGLLAIFAMFLAFPTYGERDITTYVRWLP